MNRERRSESAVGLRSVWSLESLLSFRRTERTKWTLRSRGGFSLAEVLFALAITSFALLALIGVLPQGLQSLQNAQRQEAEARIVQQAAARFQMMTWDALAQLMQTREETLYDANGTRLDQEGTDVVYRARIEVLNGLALPNETGASPYLRRIRIRITNLPNNGTALDTPSRYRERYVTLVDCDKSPSTSEADSPAGAASPTTGTPANP